MVDIRLIGSPLCRRYQKMKAVVLEEAKKMEIALDIHEIGNTESLAQLNPLSLPQLYIQASLIASKNPPKPEDIRAALRKGLLCVRCQCITYRS